MSNLLHIESCDELMIKYLDYFNCKLNNNNSSVHVLLDK